MKQTIIINRLPVAMIVNVLVKATIRLTTDQILYTSIGALAVTLFLIFKINPWLAFITFLLWVVHYFISLHFQTVFLHRYVSHQMFRFKNKFWEVVFHVGTYLSQGASYLYPLRYRLLHLEHHRFSDRKEDPHSPRHYKNIIHMMQDTAHKYGNEIPARLSQLVQYYGLGPEIKWLDRFGDGWISRLMFVAIYCISYYFLFSLFVPFGWVYIITIFCIIPHLGNGPFQGGLVNWKGHECGNRIFKDRPDDSHNTRWNVILMGEGNQNTHHELPKCINFGHMRQKFYEFDLGFHLLRFWRKLGIVEFEVIPA